MDKLPIHCFIRPVRSRLCVLKSAMLLLMAVLASQPGWSYETQWVTGYEITTASERSVRSLQQQEAVQQRLEISLSDRSLVLLVQSAGLFENVAALDLKNVPADFSVFEGVVENVPNSWVRISIIDGELFGLIDVGDDRFEVSTSVGGVSNENAEVDDVVASVDQQSRKLLKSYQLNLVPNLVSGKSFDKVLNVGIVVDELFDARFNGRGVLHAIAIINGVDGIFRQELGLAVKLDVAILAKDQDFSKLGGATPAQLSQFRQFRLQTPELLRPLSLVHLFTGSNIPNASSGVGFAYIGAVCQGTGYDISVSSHYYRDTALAAHEIGHNIGALHDTDTTACRNDLTYLMNPIVNGALAFSSCSRERIEATLKNASCVSEVHDGSIQLRRSGSSGFIVQVNSKSGFSSPVRSEVLLHYEGRLLTAPDYCYREGSDTLNCQLPLITPNKSFEFFINLDLASAGLTVADIAAEFNEEGVYESQRQNNIAELRINGTGSGQTLGSNTGSLFEAVVPTYTNLQNRNPVALVKANWALADFANRQIECKTWFWNNSQGAYVVNNSSFFRYKHTAAAGSFNSGDATVASYVSGSQQVLTGTSLDQQPWDIYDGRYSGPAAFGRSAYVEIVGVAGGQRNAIRSWSSDSTFKQCTSFPDLSSGLVPHNITGGADTCVDTAPVGDGWGWNGQTSCRVALASPVQVAGSSGVIFSATGKAVNIDGRIDQDEWASATTKDSFGTTLSLPVAIAGLRTDRSVDEWKVMHDQYNIYIALTVPDSTPFKDSKLYRHDDSVEIFFDSGNQRGPRYDQDDAQFILRESGEVEGVFNASMQVLHSRRYIPGNRHYIYEIQIAKPYEQLSGQAFGFNVQVNNDQNGGTQDAKWGWVGDTGKNIQWFRPSSFGTACLDTGIVIPECSRQPVNDICLDTGVIGDGWGWNGTQSCSINGTAGGPGDTSECVDTGVLGDGWGWNGTQSCSISVTEVGPGDTSECVDTGVIGDGWGWNGTQSCSISVTEVGPGDTSECVDTGVIGDGWGWNGAMSCRI